MTHFLTKHGYINRYVNRYVNRYLAALCLAGIVISVITACNRAPNYDYIAGETMGTSYHIRYERPNNADSDVNNVDKEAIQQAVDERLDEINASMSTYQEDSLISAFNRLPVDTSLTVDRDFITVFRDAYQVYDLSGGAFDPTVMPLIELWGFGSKMTVEQLQSPPSADQIAQAKSLIDFDSIHLTPNKTNNGDLKKLKSGVALDFSAIAKGYGVDVIAQTLQDKYKINNYMVEIGGEVATSGVNSKGRPWQIAIDAPIINSSVDTRQTIAVIRQPVVQNGIGQLHLATSGNYRNSVVFDGIRYSHTIDPITGSPIVDGASSVTVIAESVALADAWATALTAMPYTQARDKAEQLGLKVMFIVPKNQQDTLGVPEDSNLSPSVNTNVNTDVNTNMNTDVNTNVNTNVNTDVNTNDNDIVDNWQIVETSAMQALAVHYKQAS